MTQDILNTIARFFEAVDSTDWNAARALMTDLFHADYSSFGAGPAADVNPDDVLAGWDAFVPGFDRTHHQLGNLHLKSDDRAAHVRCYVTGYHAIGERVWTVVGTYDIDLIREGDAWQLSSLVFGYRFQTGDMALPELARERAAQKA